MLCAFSPLFIQRLRSSLVTALDYMRVLDLNGITGKRIIGIWDQPCVFLLCSTLNVYQISKCVRGMSHRCLAVVSRVYHEIMDSPSIA